MSSRLEGGAAAIAEIKVPPNRGTCVRHAVVGTQVDLLVLHGAPQPLDKHVVPPRAFTVHADLDCSLAQNIRHRLSRVLRAVIRIEDLRLAVRKKFGASLERIERVIERLELALTEGEAAKVEIAVPAY